MRVALALIAMVSTASAQEIASTDKAEVCGRVNGLSYSQRHRVVYRPGVSGAELDHIVPLCLGGADTDRNIQVQPWPQAREKDEFEWFACRQVCGGMVPLATAQGWFLEGWRSAMRREMR